jgi:pimeloyl-ACP methyl ester carboxylesterase
MNAIRTPHTPSSTQSQPDRRPAGFGRRLGSWLKRLLLGLAITLLVLIVAGSIYQLVATVLDRRALPMRGEMVTVGAYQLHLECSGPTTAENPTVILEAGLGATASAWAHIQADVAKLTRVCSYDRAGLGWSEASPAPRDAQQISTELHSLLDNAQIPGPYVLVGWSYGGLYIREFTHRYPTAVAGLVLVDSSHPDQCTGTPEVEAQCRQTRRTYQFAPLLARIGVIRLLNYLQPTTGLPEPQNSELLASSVATQDWDTQRAEYMASPATNEQVRQATLPKGIPLVVLTATEHDRTPEGEAHWQEWQRQLATLSTNSVHYVVEGASHYSLLFEAEDAKVSIAAIRQVVTAVQRGQPLTTAGN